MKYSFLFLLLSAYNICLAQFDWQALDPIATEAITIKHVSDDDVILGALLYPPTLLVSTDLGNTWNELHKVEDGLISLSSNNLHIRQDAAMDYYFSFGDKVYRLNEQAGQLDLFIQAEETVWDFDFLPDGNIVLATDKEMYLFDSQGNQLKKVELPTVHRELLIGDANLHYVGRYQGGTNVVVPFSSDLSDLETNDQKLAPVNAGYLYSDGRLYSNFGYLDDNGLWEEYGNGIRGTVTVLKNGDIHLIDGEQIYLSTDRAESFALLGTASELTIVYQESVAIGNEGVLLYTRRSSSCTPGAHLFSPNGITDWKILNVEQGLPVAYNVEAFNVDNVFTGTCYNSIDHYKISEEEQWRSFNPEAVSCEAIKSLVTTQTGTAISSMRCFSEDGGLNWESVGSGQEFYSIYHKAGRTFVVDWDEVYLSEDDGKTWSSYTLDFSNFPFGEWQVMDVSEEGLLYFSNFENTVAAFNMTGGVEHLINFQDGFLSDLKTSYQGREIYLLQSSLTVPDQELLTYSYDGGISFDTLDVTSMLEINYGRIQTDHLGNVYLFSGSKLWMSQDKAKTWQDISPESPNLETIVALDVSWDNYIYLATLGMGVLRSELALTIPASLTVVVFEDINSDCAFDTNDRLMDGMQVAINDFRFNTKANGEIQTYLPGGTYEISLADRADLYTSCLGMQSIILDDTQGNRTIYLPVEVLENCADIGVTSTTSRLRRCFDNTTRFTIRNEGSAPASDVTLEIILDPFYEFLSTDATVLSQLDSVLLLDMGAIAARGFENVSIQYKLSCDAELGMAHYLEAKVSASDNCIIDLAANESFECRENIGAFDPNDKSIYIDGVADAEIVNDNSELEYLIRFQNTGTDTAFTVRLEDSLSEDFNIESFKPLAASHNYEWELSRSKLIVTFNDINLVDSLTNEPDSHGFLKFGIALKDSRPAQGEIITNTAEIYFDFNDPIVTNTVESYYLCKNSQTIEEGFSCEGNAFYWEPTGGSYFETGTYTTTITSVMGCDSTVTLELTVLEENHPDCQTDALPKVEETKLAVFPNPTHNHLDILYNGNKANVPYEFYNTLGKRILSGTVTDGKIYLENIDTGVYFLRLEIEENNYISEKIVVIE